MLGPQVDPRSALAGQALVCTSPSISSRYPTTEPRLRAALADIEQAGVVPVVSEVDLFLRLCPAMTVGVTGTKGKTTTSTLIAAVLSAGQAPVVLGGNIGVPLVERLPELTPAHRVVVELSELQLPTLSRGTDVAVYTHVTSDHLDRHGTIETYRAVKRRLAELLAVDGRLVLNAEDPVSSGYEHATSARPLFYRRGEPLAGGVGVRDGWAVAANVELLHGDGAAMTGPGGRVLPLDEVQLPGAHNVSNVLAAVSVGLLFGLAPDAIRGAVAGFTGVEHRLERVAMIDGVEFINDSQGTQPDAVIAALRSFDPPIVLISGGRSKNVAIDELSREVAQRAAAVVVIGETADEFTAAFAAAGANDIERAADLETAVRRSNEIAQAHGGGTVLLSPAATSFDMFVDYAARGNAFKDIVHRLAAERGGGS
jgi:UDP-N-acetylmuramoylalanine--D-glutamate ligase